MRVGPQLVGGLPEVGRDLVDIDLGFHLGGHGGWIIASGARRVCQQTRGIRHWSYLGRAARAAAFRVLPRSKPQGPRMG